MKFTLSKASTLILIFCVYVPAGAQEFKIYPENMFLVKIPPPLSLSPTPSHTFISVFYSPILALLSLFRLHLFLSSSSSLFIFPFSLLSIFFIFSLLNCPSFNFFSLFFISSLSVTVYFFSFTPFYICYSALPFIFLPLSDVFSVTPSSVSFCFFCAYKNSGHSFERQLWNKKKERFLMLLKRERESRENE